MPGRGQRLEQVLGSLLHLLPFQPGGEIDDRPEPGAGRCSLGVAVETITRSGGAGDSLEQVSQAGGEPGEEAV
jgi:hypothetical protein